MPCVLRANAADEVELNHMMNGLIEAVLEIATEVMVG